DFRPVGVAVGPDGALYLSDWVDKSYPVHGKGRIWRVRMKEPPKDDHLRASALDSMHRDDLLLLLAHPRKEIRQAASHLLSIKGWSSTDNFEVTLLAASDRAKVQAMWGLASLGPADALKPLVWALRDRSP